MHILARNVMDKLDSLECELCLAVNTTKLEDRIKELEAENASLRSKLMEKEEKE